MESAHQEAEDGLRDADMYGFGLFRVDLRNTIGEFCFSERRFEDARQFASSALELADDADCDYFWGRLDAHSLLEKVLPEFDDGAGASQHGRRAEDLRMRIQLTSEMLRPLIED